MSDDYMYYQLTDVWSSRESLRSDRPDNLIISEEDVIAYGTRAEYKLVDTYGSNKQTGIGFIFNREDAIRPTWHQNESFIEEKNDPIAGAVMGIDFDNIDIDNLSVPALNKVEKKIEIKNKIKNSVDTKADNKGKVTTTAPNVDAIDFSIDEDLSEVDNNNAEEDTDIIGPVFGSMQPPISYPKLKEYYESLDDKQKEILKDSELKISNLDDLNELMDNPDVQYTEEDLIEQIKKCY